MVIPHASMKIMLDHHHEHDHDMGNYGDTRWQYDHGNHEYDDHEKYYLSGCQMCGSVCLNDQNLAEVKVGAENIFE